MPVENGSAENGEQRADGDDKDEEEEVVEVPREVEVEEIVEREMMQDVVETRKIPQVRAMYPYKGQGMAVEKGEVSYICYFSSLFRFCFVFFFCCCFFFFFCFVVFFWGGH